MGHEVAVKLHDLKTLAYALGLAEADSDFTFNLEQLEAIHEDLPDAYEAGRLFGRTPETGPDQGAG